VVVDCDDSQRRGRDLGPTVARFDRFPHLQQELFLVVIPLPALGMIKLDEMGAAPLGECPPLLGYLVERQSRMPVRHESHRDSDCDGASSPQNGYQSFNAAALKTVHGKKHVKLTSDIAEAKRPSATMSKSP